MRSAFFRFHPHTCKCLSACSPPCLFLSTLTIILRRDSHKCHMTFPLSLPQEKMPDPSGTKLDISCLPSPALSLLWKNHYFFFVWISHDCQHDTPNLGPSDNKPCRLSPPYNILHAPKVIDWSMGLACKCGCKLSKWRVVH